MFTYLACEKSKRCTGSMMTTVPFWWKMRMIFGYQCATISGITHSCFTAGAHGRPFAAGPGFRLKPKEKVDRWIWMNYRNDKLRKSKWHDFFVFGPFGGLKSYEFILILQMRNRQKGWWRILHVSALLSWKWLQTIESDIVNYKNDTLKLVRLCLRPNSWAKKLGAEHPDESFGIQRLVPLTKVVPSFQRLVSPKAIRKAIAKRYPLYSECS